MTLRFFYGPMGAGKSTLALQYVHNLESQGLYGRVATTLDRSGKRKITSRIGASRYAHIIKPVDDLRELVNFMGRDFLVVDESQFLRRRQVDQLGELADQGVGVYAFGITTDFKSRLFKGSRRLFEIADELIRLPLEVYCSCGSRGLINARVSADGEIARSGSRIEVGDTDGGGYEVMCRRCYGA